MLSKFKRVFLEFLRSKSKYYFLGEKLFEAYVRTFNKQKTFAYTHLWRIDQNKNTHILLNHFLSPLLPEYKDEIIFVVELLNAHGKPVGTKEFSVKPFAGKSVSVKEILNPSCTDSFGMVLVYVKVNPALQKEIKKTGSGLLLSYFFVAWEDANGSTSCSHAIEAFKGQYFNVPSFFRYLVRIEELPTSTNVVSNKVIQTEGLQSIDIFINNPSYLDRELHYDLLGTAKQTQTIRLSGKETKHLHFEKSDDWSKTPFIRLCFDQLSTINAKPYCFLKYEGNTESIGFHV